MTLNKKKYQNAILYLCQNLKGELRGKKKLAKLLYFADFDLYEKKQQSITGDVYKALPMGPFPTMLEEITKEMTKNEMLEVEKVEEWKGLLPTETYKCIQPPNMSVFSNEEKRMLDRIIKKYGHLNGKQLEELSHAEAPYIATKLKQEIPYELAFYRGTDFADL